MIEKDDNLLVSEVLDGNINSFGFLISRYQGPLYRYLLKTVRDSEAAKDILQNVFIKAYEKLYSFNTDYKFFSWIYRIAVNESINFSKIKYRNQSLFVEKDEIPFNDNPLEQVEKKEVSEQVNKALLKLKPEFRTLVVLKHFEDFSYQEISEMTGLTEKKIKSRLYMARQILKDALLTQLENVHE